MGCFMRRFRKVRGQKQLRPVVVKTPTVCNVNALWPSLSISSHLAKRPRFVTSSDTARELS